MRLLKPKKAALTVVMMGTALLMNGCGSSNGSGSSAAAPAPSANNTTLAGGIGGCLSLTQPLGFTDQTGYVDSINIGFGTEPTTDPLAPGQTFGQTMLTAGGAGGPYMAPNSQLTISPDGNISMNVIPMSSGQLTTGTLGSYGTGVGTTAMMTGTITISTQKQQLVMTELAAAYPSTGYSNYTIPGAIPGATVMPQTTLGMSSICIVSVAGALSHSGYNLYGGHAYAYFYVPNMTSMTGMTSSPAGLTGAALYSLPKIVLTF